MIISASRRTDIPAFYARWFMNRIRAGYCTVPNPFNPRQVATVSLHPEEVDVIVFWTRNPRPLLPFLSELDGRGYRYYFQYTLLDHPRQVDPGSPPMKTAIRTFLELAGKIGPDRVIWRYDPIVFTSLTPPDVHLAAYRRIARALRGSTRRSVISLVDPYPKIQKRMAEMAGRGAPLLPFGPGEAGFGPFVCSLAEAARENGMEIVSCAEEIDLRPFGVKPGKCVDNELIGQIFGIEAAHQKDPSQRKACGCVVSKDIGMYDSCLFGCPYCYATTSFERARANHERHDPNSPSLVGWHEPRTPGG